LLLRNGSFFVTIFWCGGYDPKITEVLKFTGALQSTILFKNSSGGIMTSLKFVYKVILCLAGVFVLILLVCCSTTKLKQPKIEDSMSSDVAKKQIDYFLEINPEKEKQYQEVQAELFTTEYVMNHDVFLLNSIFPTENTYKNRNFRISKLSWYEYIEMLCETYGKEQIQIKELSIICEAKDAIPQEGETVSGNYIFAKEGYFNTQDISEPIVTGKKVKALIYQDRITGIISELENDINLDDCCLLSEENGKIVFFWNYHEISLKKDEEEKNKISYGQIGDLEVSEQTVHITKIKEEIISGKVLTIKEDALEIEGHGTIKKDKNMVVYRMVGKTKQTSADDILLGYQFCDFVIDGGKIVAGLIMQEKDMDKIRVLLQTANYGGQFHDKINIVCDSDIDMIKTKDGNVEKQETISANNSIEFTSNDLKDSERIRLVPKTLSAKFYGQNLNRSCGVPVYGGAMEITKTEEGLILINEILLEEYLYGVVPAEMPSSYHNEALKAQAICARTYAYNNMLSPGLAQYGAHVDDSTSFQVYQNISPTLNTTNAVKETKGQILSYHDTPVSTYYYSTSCGVGTDMTAWNEESQVPYLKSKNISANAKDMQLTEEEKFRQFIMQIYTDDFESKEGWYRWKYQNADLDVSALEDKLNDIDDISLGKIKDIRITKRAPGGVATELIIEGKKNTITVSGELNIRKALCDGITKVEKHTGEMVEMKSLLPSAYFMIELKKEGKYVTGYTLYGGGYGHGIGMSQNGAQQMALYGMPASDILQFFYEGSTIERLYEGNEEP